MRNEREIRELKDELDRLTGFIADYGTQQELECEPVGFSNNVSDALSWVLKEVSAFLELPRLPEVAESIQKRTGVGLARGETIDTPVAREPCPIRHREEVREFKEELNRSTRFVREFGTQQESEDDLVRFSKDMSDALSWVLEEVSTEQFRSDAYLDLPALRKIAESIEKRTGEDLAAEEASDMTVVRRPRLHYLLELEKQRRGVAADRLVFVDMRNAARYWWCAMQSVLRSRGEEVEVFAAYLKDRHAYSKALGRATGGPSFDDFLKAPSVDAEAAKQVLETGEGLTWKDVEPLLRQGSTHRREWHEYFFPEVGKPGPHFSYGPDAEWAALEREWIDSGAWQEGDAITRGQVAQHLMAEKHPTFRWNFPWNEYVLVGRPLGLTDSFVYLFTSTSALHFTGPVVRTEGDLYGYFFQRPKKRIQFHIPKTGEIQTLETEVDLFRAKEVLEKFRRVDRGQEVPVPPRARKCKQCSYLDSCSISPLKN